MHSSEDFYGVVVFSLGVAAFVSFVTGIRAIRRRVLEWRWTGGEGDAIRDGRAQLAGLGLCGVAVALAYVTYLAWRHS